MDTISRAVIDDMLADTRETFDASGPETPQAVRDVIEYVASWLTVALDKPALAALAAPAQHEARQRCIDARNALNAALHGDGAVIDTLEQVVASACAVIKRHAAPAQPNTWREAVLDALTATGSAMPATATPAEIVRAVIDANVQIALDPRVSDAAPAQQLEKLGPTQPLELNLRSLALQPATAIKAFGVGWAGRVAASAIEKLAAQAPQPKRAIAGLGRMTDDDGGYVTLQFVDEAAAQAFMGNYVPSVDIDDMPPIREDAPAQQPEPLTLPEHQRSAPPAIYLHDGDDGHTEPFPSGMDDGVTWSSDNATGLGVAYVRADLAAKSPAPATATDKESLTVAQAQAATGAVMPCGALVTNVLDAYEAGKRAATAVPAVTDGYVQVPLTITEDMHTAAVRTIVRCTGNDEFPRRVWAAMLAAAPKNASPSVKS